MARERLQKLMARAGLGSRRACEEMIRAGRVMLNGRLAALGDQADLAVDKVYVDGVPLKLTQTPTTVALYKPMQALSTDRPHRGDRRPTARSLISLETRLFAIGRLDADSEGLMLFTNDGDLAHRLSHPRFGHEKEYRVLVAGRPTEEVLGAWRRGVELEDGMTAPAGVTLAGGEKGSTWLRITMHEGRKRQIRRVAAALGHPVRRLIRVRIGPVQLGQLKPGEWRSLTEAELAALRGGRRIQKRPRRGRTPKKLGY
jgi:23S rRNA pseudouridine2605 synthase